ncbi:hypothetical protein CDAR_871 [Caerostris darwini]|uniref:Uncharacterized protein n=1 Tax=Caerostris darwini TaxID=1538125 RepID=A0AAV4SLL1_9ARAC|nr:hypothetical protein CDAR_871 [Caerostris darwini]
MRGHIVTFVDISLRQTSFSCNDHQFRNYYPDAIISRGNRRCAIITLLVIEFRSEGSLQNNSLGVVISNTRIQTSNNSVQMRWLTPCLISHFESVRLFMFVRWPQ